ncbi:MAG TPA: 3-hydroxyacyl-CoA dehydrogenase family protein [Candidatus Nanopelagicaceae bacterium]|nr:3-hydroxyacyl-CoA dehydrogenase family protein [Candidatus Nanopelagicaceae bacterium]
MAEIKNIVMIGAGLMGHNAAQICLMAGYNVTLVDIKDEFVDAGVAKIDEGLKKLEGKGKLGEGITAASLMGNLKKSIDIASAVKDADFVIEAVVEKMDVKKQVFKTCDENAPPHCILATNTSTMSITEIASATNREDKVIGMHFFNPPILMRLIEIIAGEKSSDEAMDIGVELSNSLPCLKGKRFVPKVLKDRPGFIVNRLNAPVQIYLNWVFDQAAEKGIPWEQIDADAAGLMPMGPCELADYVGIDTMFHVGNYYAETLSPDFKPGKIITKMVEENKLGRKSPHGFFDWTAGRSKIDKSKKAGLFTVENSMAIMLNEGCRLLDEKVVTGFKVIDEANMAGMNTPGPFGGGKNQFEKWSTLLDELADKTGKDYLRPCELMKSGGFVKMRK